MGTKVNFCHKDPISVLYAHQRPGNSRARKRLENKCLVAK